MHAIWSITFSVHLRSVRMSATRETNDERYDNIQGEWVLISGERHGQPFSDETIKDVTLTFDGDVLKTSKADGSPKLPFTLHPETNPRGIDLDMDGSVGLGIYKLEDDTLTVLHGEIEEPRPKGL